MYLPDFFISGTQVTCVEVNIHKWLLLVFTSWITKPSVEPKLAVSLFSLHCAQYQLDRGANQKESLGHFISFEIVANKRITVILDHPKVGGAQGVWGRAKGKWYRKKGLSTPPAECHWPFLPPPSSFPPLRCGKWKDTEARGEEAGTRNCWTLRCGDHSGAPHPNPQLQDLWKGHAARRAHFLCPC